MLLKCALLDGSSDVEGSTSHELVIKIYLEKL